MQTVENDAAQPGYRSGVAARLAGLSAATLRVWERRYQLTAAPRAANGQRLYTPPQVRRLGLLKQLVDQGHPIGTLAAMPLERLALMAAPMVQRGGVIDVAAIGAGLARRLAAAIDDGLPLRLLELDGASSPSSSPAPLVLLVELAEPDAGAPARLAELRRRSGAAAVVVLYRFCSSAMVRAMRADGFLVARFPGEMGELPLLCQAALQRQGTLAAPLAVTAAAARFDELALTAIGTGEGIADGTRRDCARALAGMLQEVASFERYSARCAADAAAAATAAATGAPPASAADSAMHQHLEQVAGRARVLLEQALGRLLRAAG
jgi:hypothetical protein